MKSLGRVLPALAMPENLNHAPQWPRLPTAHCIKFLAEEMSLGGLVKMALTNQTGMPSVLTLVQHAARANGVSIRGLDYVKTMADHAAPRAKEQVEAGFHMVHVHALINMWGAIMTALEQTIAGCIVHDRNARATACGLLNDRGNPERKIGEDEAASMASRLIARSAASKPAQHAYPALCDKFEMRLDTVKYPFPGLEEVRCIRNSLVHRNGIVTQQIANASEDYRGLVGKPIRLEERASVRHAEAINNFALALSDAAIHSRYCLGPDAGSK